MLLRRRRAKDGSLHGQSGIVVLDAQRSITGSRRNAARTVLFPGAGEVRPRLCMDDLRMNGRREDERREEECKGKDCFEGEGPGYRDHLDQSKGRFGQIYQLIVKGHDRIGIEPESSFSSLSVSATGL